MNRDKRRLHEAYGIVRNSTGILLLNTIEHYAKDCAINFIINNADTFLTEENIKALKGYHPNTILAKFRQLYGWTFSIKKLNIKEY